MDFETLNEIQLLFTISSLDRPHSSQNINTLRCNHPLTFCPLGITGVQTFLFFSNEDHSFLPLVLLFMSIGGFRSQSRVGNQQWLNATLTAGSACERLIQVLFSDLQMEKLLSYPHAVELNLRLHLMMFVPSLFFFLHLSVSTK